MRSYFRRADPFFDEQENHSLIGVANVFLSCLFYDVKLQYAVPIINQKGEVGGHRLANVACSKLPLSAFVSWKRLVVMWKVCRIFPLMCVRACRWLGVFMWRW